jgi:hypothetical protein
VSVLFPNTNSAQRYAMLCNGLKNQLFTIADFSQAISNEPYSPAGLAVQAPLDNGRSHSNAGPVAVGFSFAPCLSVIHLIGLHVSPMKPVNSMPQSHQAAGITG